jgi:hypothetical protein
MNDRESGGDGRGEWSRGRGNTPLAVYRVRISGFLKRLVHYRSG